MTYQSEAGCSSAIIVAGKGPEMKRQRETAHIANSPQKLEQPGFFLEQRLALLFLSLLQLSLGLHPLQFIEPLKAVADGLKVG